jgi:choline dehydrogenase
VRPHDSDWQAIADATQDESWSPRAMDDYFARVERCLYRTDPKSGHGRDGWLPTRLPDLVQLVEDSLEHHDLSIGRIAAQAALSQRDRLRSFIELGADRVRLGKKEAFALRFDPNDIGVLERNRAGLIAIPTAIDENGRRRGTRERIREAQGSGRLEVRLHSHVVELVFDPNDKLRAIGVKYREGKRIYRADRESGNLGEPGDTVEVHATRDVILSAGAYLTPQLLMLAGIGPREELEGLGITMRANRPGVGRHLQDRYEVGIVAQTLEEFGLLSKATFGGPDPREATGDPPFEQWRKGEQGLYATNGAVLGFTARSSVAEMKEPDLFIFGVPGSFVGYYTGWAAESVERPYNKWTWLLLKAHARFRGRVTLETSDPLDPPHVDFNYFERGPDGTPTDDTRKDLVAMREGVRFVNKLLDGAKGLQLHPEAMKGVDLTSDEGIDTFVQDRAWGHHASCTCKIGGDDDEMAVLDSRFRVRAENRLLVKGLRVVDASVFPKIPGFFVVSAVYMIAEKAADAILADAHDA